MAECLQIYMKNCLEKSIRKIAAAFPLIRVVDSAPSRRDSDEFQRRCTRTVA